MKTILVIRSSAMGDVAMTAPVVKSLLATYPNVRVVMLTRGFFEPFFVEDERFSIYNVELHGRHKGFAGIRKLYKELRSEYKIDFVADLHDKIYSKLLCLFFRIGGVKTYQLDKGRSEKRALTRKENKVKKQLRTTVLRYCDVFEKAGMPVIVDTELRRVERDIPAIFGSKNETWIGISPFAQHRGKMLGISTIKQTIALIEQNYPEAKVFLFGGGSSEAEIAAEIEKEYPNAISVIGKIKLKEELDLIANLDVMLSMDSSAMHMSSLVGVKVVSVWAATHPYAGFMGIGQSDENAVQVDDLECRPCSVYGNKPCYREDYACLNNINAYMILAKIEQLIPSPCSVFSVFSDSVTAITSTDRKSEQFELNIKININP